MTVTPTLRTSAHCGYVEAQESLMMLFGQRIEYYDAPHSFWDDYSNYIPVNISILGFDYENQITIDGDTVSTGIVVPRVDTNIRLDDRVPMIDRANGERYDMKLDPNWDAARRDDEVTRFVKRAYSETIRQAVIFSHPNQACVDVHTVVRATARELQTGEDGEHRYDIYDFVTKDTGLKLQFTWEMRMGDDAHNMCVEYDKKTHEICAISEHYEEDGELVRQFTMSTFSSHEDVFENTLANDLEFMIENIVEEYYGKQKARAAGLIDDLEQNEQTL